MDPVTREETKQEFNATEARIEAGLDVFGARTIEDCRQESGALGDRLAQAHLDMQIRLDNRFLAILDRMEKRFDAFEDRFMRLIADSVEANDRNFARQEGMLSDLIHSRKRRN